MIVSLVVHPEKGVPQIAICVPKLYHNLEKWGEIEVFSPHFAPFCGTHVVHFSLSCTKVRQLFQTK